MPLNPPHRTASKFDRAAVFQNLVFVFCVLFGLAMIADTQAPNDGTWFWYATFLRNGKLLYADMHLALQPLFVVETAAFLKLLGNGWLASKVPAILHLVAYCAGLLLVVRCSNLSDRKKTLVLACAFFASIDFVGYRFDDYHVLADCFEIYSLAILLILENVSAQRQRFFLVAALGVLSGLSLTTRLNDGAALFVGVAIAYLCMAHSKRIVSLALFSATASLTVLLVVRSTGDSLHDWAMNSIFKAAASKGGTSNVLAYPLRLPWTSAKFLSNIGLMLLVAYILGAVLIWVALIRPLWRSRRPVDLLKMLAGTVLILLPFPYFRHYLAESFSPALFPALGVVLAYGLGLTVLIRFLRWKLAIGSTQTWNAREMLLIIPLGQLASSSMSSAGFPFGLNGPLAIIILLLPIASPFHLKRESARAFAFTILALLTVDCAVHKYRYPYSWHSYKNAQLFVGRQWYTHPDYGPMIIERDDLAFIQPVCNAVKSDGAQQGLLSLPYSYPNYFCSITPWHGYVQTFFDTSGKETIDRLMDELQNSPPKWILYQRQLDTLALHERVYNHGAPLPHRYLDQLIEQKIALGNWHVVYTSNFEDSSALHNQWFLIQTH